MWIEHEGGIYNLDTVATISKDNLKVYPTICLQFANDAEADLEFTTIEQVEAAYIVLKNLLKALTV